MTKHLCILAAAAVATTFGAGLASSRTTSRSFLTPLTARFVAPAPTTGFCGQLAAGRRCPPVLVYSGPSSGGPLPTIDPALKDDLPHGRVSMVLQEIANVIVSGGGVTVAGLNPHVEWATTPFLIRYGFSCNEAGWRLKTRRRRVVIKTPAAMKANADIQMPQVLRRRRGVTGTCPPSPRTTTPAHAAGGRPSRWACRLASRNAAATVPPSLSDR